ncbi:hypothetical protein [Armatimonas sp.]|uniref:hypothetical protein n=1 Tax=Armatimonas sp. TaxID=1872638 RepID=UPI00286A8AFE|nr:hypothetical protein [Armatimonas sp.]
MKITNEQIIAVAEGSADALTERLVLAAALHDPALQRRLTLLRSVDADEEPLPQIAPARLARLTEEMEVAARRVGREFAEAQATPSPSWFAAVGGTLRRSFTLERRSVRLSALAPALAASDETLQVQRDIFDIEGVHIEIHQLPENPPRLRFLVDAHRAEGFLAEEVSAVTLALQEEGGLDLWLVTVPLNAEGRGLWEQPAPTIRGAVGLLGVALVGA